MAAKLIRGASGARHLRWARQILANAKAHSAFDYLLTEPQKSALATEVGVLEGLVARLAGSVSAYGDFLATAYVDSRAKQSVGDYLCDQAQIRAEGHLKPRRADVDRALPGGFSSVFSGMPLSRIRASGREATVAYARVAATQIRSLPASLEATALADALERAAGVLAGFHEEERATIDPKRVPLRHDVEMAVHDLREGLEQIDGRLRTHFPQSFIDSLYPPLSRTRVRVAADPDEDDDDSSPEE